MRLRLPQIRVRVRASRRMRTAARHSPHASRRIAAQPSWGNVLLAWRCDAPQHEDDDARRVLASPAAARPRRTNLRLWESGAGPDPLFRVVLYNENCNLDVSSRQRAATAWECRRVRSPPPTCRCRRRGGLSTPRACRPWLRSQARRSAASPPASPRFRESPCSRAR